MEDVVLIALKSTFPEYPYHLALLTKPITIAKKNFNKKSSDNDNMVTSYAKGDAIATIRLLERVPQQANRGLIDDWQNLEFVLKVGIKIESTILLRDILLPATFQVEGYNRSNYIEHAIEQGYFSRYGKIEKKAKNVFILTSEADNLLSTPSDLICERIDDDILVAHQALENADDNEDDED